MSNELQFKEWQRTTHHIRYLLSCNFPWAVPYVHYRQQGSAPQVLGLQRLRPARHWKHGRLVQTERRARYHAYTHHSKYPSAGGACAVDSGQERSSERAIERASERRRSEGRREEKGSEDGRRWLKRGIGSKWCRGLLGRKTDVGCISARARFLPEIFSL